MDQPDELEAQARASLYLGILAHDSMAWFLKSEQRVLGDYEPRWHWNLGIPSAGYDDDRIRKGFLRVLRAARMLSEGQPPFTLREARRLLGAPTCDDPHLDVVPEVVAEVVGYCRSHLRTPGLHVVVDVGASTLDVCGFVLDEYEDQQVYSLLTALVERRGLHELHRWRLASLANLNAGRTIKHGMATLDLSDPFAVIPNAIGNYIERDNGLPASVVEIDRCFAAECTRQVFTCLDHLRKRRCWSTPTWSSGVPVFVAGGGASSQFYRDAIAEASARCVRSWQRVAPLHELHLPVPPQLQNEDLQADGFARLAVAYGLSFDRLDIGYIFPPHKIPDEPPQRIRATPDFVSKDQV